MNRVLTGNWYIRKKLFGFKIMVEVKYQAFYPDIPLQYEKAKPEDLKRLNINIY